MQLLPQQGVQLETLPVAIQHSQQRRIDKLVARFAPLRLRKTGYLQPFSPLCFFFSLSGRAFFRLLSLHRNPTLPQARLLHRQINHHLFPRQINHHAVPHHINRLWWDDLHVIPLSYSTAN